MSLPIKNAGTKAWKNLPSYQNTTAYDHKCAEIVKKERNRSAEPQRSDTVTPSQAENQRHYNLPQQFMYSKYLLELSFLQIRI